jgi:lysophospholipid acyltransferase (LPLAT)-like uncharacterized protein
MPIHTSALLSTVITIAVRMLAWTWRLQVTDESGLRTSRESGTPPLIWVFWHNRLLVVPILYGRFFRHRKSAVLISRSRDGGILAGVIERFGGRPIRGSSSRGGASALRELERKVGQGYDAYITPDGPKGPCYSVGAGAIWLAQHTGAALLPVSVEVSKCWRLGRWDGFLIPKPFARVKVTMRALHRISPTTTDLAVKEEQERLRILMMSQTDRQ